VRSPPALPQDYGLPRTILHDYLMTQALRTLFGDDAAENVGAAAGRAAYDVTIVFGRVVLPQAVGSEIARSGRSRLKSSLKGVTGACITPFNINGISLSYAIPVPWPTWP